MSVRTETLAKRLLAVLAAGLLVAAAAGAAEFTEIVAQIKPGIVGVGTYEALRRPPNKLSGTGFAVGDGTLIVTNAHVIEDELDPELKERRVVFVGRGRKPSRRDATVLAVDEFHDLAVLRITGPPVPTLELGTSPDAREGQSIAFTGFPIGAVLGLYPVTHQGIISAISPSAIPQPSIKKATAAQLRRLREPFNVFQLDATAYPGNSGSPVYDQRTGRVIGIINSVLVKESKENALKDPSAISYAIPVQHVEALLARAKQP